MGRFDKTFVLKCITILVIQKKKREIKRFNSLQCHPECGDKFKMSISQLGIKSLGNY